MPRPKRESPASLAPGWPDVPSSDPIAEVARRFTVNVRDAIGDRSIRSAAAAIGVPRETLASILEGRSWVDLATIARVEAGMKKDLWPGRADGVVSHVES